MCAFMASLRDLKSSSLITNCTTNSVVAQADGSCFQIHGNPLPGGDSKKKLVVMMKSLLPR